MIGIIIVQYFLLVFFKLLFRLKSYGVENIPANCPLLIVVNHASNFDPFLCGVYIFSKRDVHFLAKQELFSNKFTKWVFTALHTHPIKRGQVDRQAIAAVLKLLEQKKALMIFPEGTRSQDGTLQRGKAGVGFLIYQAKVPILPIYIENSFQALSKGKFFPRPCKIRVFFGKPQVWSDLWDAPASREIYQEISDRCLKEISQLKPTS